MAWIGKMVMYKKQKSKTEMIILSSKSSQVTLHVALWQTPLTSLRILQGIRREVNALYIGIILQMKCRTWTKSFWDNNKRIAIQNLSRQNTLGACMFTALKYHCITAGKLFNVWLSDSVLLDKLIYIASFVIAISERSSVYFFIILIPLFIWPQIRHWSWLDWLSVASWVDLLIM